MRHVQGLEKKKSVKSQLPLRMNHRDNKNHTAWVKTFTEYRRPGAIKQIAEPVPLEHNTI